MSTDEQFARALREHAAALTPQVTVRTDGVVPAARRRRAAQVGVLTLVTGLVLGGGGAFAGAGWAAGPEVGPAGLEEPTAAPAVSPPAPSPSADPGWPDAPYWHLVYTSTLQSQDTDSGAIEVETWIGHTAPSIEVHSEGMPGASSSPPGTFASLLVDGVETELDWDDVYALPTDPAALERVLRAGVFPDDVTDPVGRKGPADLQVWNSARRLLLWAPSPPALRDALWQVLVGLPGVTVQEGAADSLGRPGVAATLDLGNEASVQSIVYDPEARQGLEQVKGAGAAARLSTFLEQGPADAVPADVAERVLQVEAGSDSAVPAGEVLVPDLVGMQATDASRSLAELGLAANLVPVPGTGLPMGVVAHVAQAGQAVRVGAVVELQVSTGKPAR